MAVFLMLTTLTEAGRRTLEDTPQRIKEVNKEFEKEGVKVINQYALLGQYDFVNILEAPSNEVMAKVVVALGARGTLQTVTLVAIPIDAFIAGIQKK